MIKNLCSVVCASNRPNRMVLQIESVFGNRHASAPYELEMVLVTSLDVPADVAEAVDKYGVKVVRDDFSGSAAGTNLGYHACDGEWVSFCPDDFVMNPLWYTCADFIKQMPAERRHRVAGLHHWGSPTQCPLWMAHRDTLRNDCFQDNLFNPAYRHHYADCDTSLMMWDQGEVFGVCPGIGPYVDQHFDGIWFDSYHRWSRHDYLVFKENWSPVIKDFVRPDIPLAEGATDELAAADLLRSRYRPKPRQDKITLSQY